MRPSRPKHAPRKIRGPRTAALQRKAQRALAKVEQAGRVPHRYVVRGMYRRRNAHRKGFL